MHNKNINLRLAAILGIAIAASWLVTFFGVRLMLTSMYNGTAGEALSGLLTNRDQHPLDYYFQLLNAPILAAHLMLVIAAAVFLTRPLRSPLIWLGLLLAGDVLLLYFSEKYGGPLLDIVVDWSLPEVFQYSKEIALAAFFALVYRHNRQFLYAMFAGIALFLFLDDAFKYHETMGHVLAPVLSRTSLPAMAGTEANFVGEIVSLLPLLFLLPFGAVSFFRTDRETQIVAFISGVFVVVLFVFGVIVDLMGNMSPTDSTIVIPGIHIIEDFGEMLTLTGWVTYMAHRYWITTNEKSE